MLQVAWQAGRCRTTCMVATRSVAKCERAKVRRKCKHWRDVRSGHRRGTAVGLPELLLEGESSLDVGVDGLPGPGAPEDFLGRLTATIQDVHLRMCGSRVTLGLAAERAGNGGSVQKQGTPGKRVCWAAEMGEEWARSTVRGRVPACWTAGPPRPRCPSVSWWGSVC